MLDLLLRGRAAEDADTLAWAQAVITAGGSVTATRRRLVSQLVTALKACGAWAVTDDYAIHAGENSIQSLVTLKRRLTQVAVNGPTHTPSRGFQGNGSSQYVNLGWNYATATYYARNDARYSFWSETAPTTTTGHSMGTNNLYASWIFGAANVSYGINGDTVGGGYATYAHGGNKTGWFSAVRTGASAMKAFRNNASVDTDTFPSLAPENFNVVAHAYSTSSVPAVGGFSDGRIAALCYGKALSAGQAAGEYAALRAFMTAIGVA